MNKIFIVLIIIVMISSPVSAISFQDIFSGVKGLFSNIKGSQGETPTGFRVNLCVEGTKQCDTCDGDSCVNICSNGTWTLYGYCQYQCSDGECVNEGPIGVDLCAEGTKQCDTCDGDSCVNICSNNEWVLDSYCQDQCLGGECIESVPLQCNDGTINNQCNVNFKYCNQGVLEDNCNECGCPTGKRCEDNQCIMEEGNYDPGGDENDNPNLLNHVPLIHKIDSKTIKIGKTLQFEIIAIDEDNDELIYSFRAPEIIRCSISENKIGCRGIEKGEGKLNIIVSDGKDKIKEEVTIIVLEELPKFQKRVKAGITNTPPVADAGSDKTGILGQKIILDASRSYDYEGFLSIPETYKWYKENNLIGTGKSIEKQFTLGKHKIKLIVTDSESETNEDTITITIKEKTVCKNTQTFYYPEDTKCNNKWPIKEGKKLEINSPSEACSLFEVCSEELDPIIGDSINCCKGDLVDPKKAATCNFAKENFEDFKNCQAGYLIKSLGKASVYMKKYFDAEMCCKGVEEICPQSSNLYTANPLPEHLKNKGLKCSNTPDNNNNGYWASDSNWELNEISLFDAPAHVSLTELNTGTCVDYSVAVTTLVRKVGFSKDQVVSVETSNHAFNLWKPNSFKKWILLDMTGNNEGFKPGKKLSGYEYCENIVSCYNDFGKVQCPDNNDIFGCEGKSKKIGREAQNVGLKITGTFSEFINRIKEELLR